MTRSIAGVALVSVFAVVVGATIVGVAANWPRKREVVSLPGSVRSPATVHANVVAVRAVRCQTPGFHGCERVTARLRGGRLTTFGTGDSGRAERPAVGDAILVYRTQFPAGARQAGGAPVDAYAFEDFERKRPLGLLALLFAVTALATGRLRGLRALFGLGLSLAMVVFFIVPAIADGRPPLQVVVFGALGVMLLTIPLVHGGGPKALAACLGTATALVLTLALADVFTHLAHLSGVTSDEAIYLQATKQVSLQGLLLAGMVIGALGVLGDTTVTQASTVIALHRANPALRFTALVTHATAVGRDHIAATVNTLVLAYTGAAIPVLLIFSLAGTSLGSAVNSEAVAGAIVATLVGSIGLMAAVPLTTALAAFLVLARPRT
jgi:uncharacterized membrane protein